MSSRDQAVEIPTWTMLPKRLSVKGREWDEMVAGLDPEVQGRESLFFVFLRWETLEPSLERRSRQRKRSCKVAKG